MFNLVSSLSQCVCDDNEQILWHNNKALINFKMGSNCCYMLDVCWAILTRWISFRKSVAGMPLRGWRHFAVCCCTNAFIGILLSCLIFDRQVSGVKDRQPHSARFISFSRDWQQIVFDKQKQLCNAIGIWVNWNFSRREIPRKPEKVKLAENVQMTIRHLTFKRPLRFSLCTWWQIECVSRQRLTI